MNVSTFSEETRANKTRCDRSVETYHCQPIAPSTNEFNYERFKLYLKFQYEHERRQRILSLKNGEKVLELVDFTDDVLANELMNMYGEMNRGSEQFRKLLNNYKEERLETIIEWIEEEQELDNFMYDDDSDSFTEQELEIYHKIAQSTSDFEAFILPRLCCTSRDNNLSGDNAQQFAKLDISHRCTLTPGLVSRFQKISQKHWFGITPTEFIRIVTVDKNLDFRKFGSDNYTDLLLDPGHVLWSQPIDLQSGHLIYPKCLQDLISTPLEIFWKILHQFKVILTISSGIIRVSAAIRLFEELFGLKLNDEKIRSWGFKSREEFIQFLFNHWSHPQIKWVNRNNFKVTSRQIDELYLVHFTESSLKLMRHQSNQSSAASVTTYQTNPPTSQPKFPAQPPARTLPSGCVSSMKEVGHEMFEVQKGRETKCRLACYYNPCFFFVNLVSQIQVLEEFQQLLRKEYQSRKNEELRVTSSHHLTNDIPIVVWDHSSQEFYRAILIEEVEPSFYKFRSIDFGYLLKGGLTDIWFLSTKFAHKLLGQAIPCQLYNVIEGTVWDESIEQYACDLMENHKGMIVSFKDRHINPEGRRVYLVRVTTVSNKKLDIGDAITAFIKEHHLDVKAKIQSKCQSQVPKLVNPQPQPQRCKQPDFDTGYVNQKQNREKSHSSISGSSSGLASVWGNLHSSNTHCSKTPQATQSKDAPNQSKPLKSWAQVTTGKQKLSGQRRSPETDFPPLK